MIFANEQRTAVVTLWGKAEDAVTTADITENVLSAEFSTGGGLNDATLESSGTVEQVLTTVRITKL